MAVYDYGKVGKSVYGEIRKGLRTKHHQMSALHCPLRIMFGARGEALPYPSIVPTR